jgi:hypothetical protein
MPLIIMNLKSKVGVEMYKAEGWASISKKVLSKNFLIKSQPLLAKLLKRFSLRFRMVIANTLLDQFTGLTVIILS